MNSFINFNGKLFKKNDALLKVNNRAFCYGDALFETMRWHGKKILFMEDHLERLLRGMKFLKMETRKRFSAGFIQQHTSELIAKNKISRDARIRFQVYRKEGGYYIPADNFTGFVIIAGQLNETSYSLNKKGLRAGVFSEVSKPASQVSNYKTTNSIIYTLAGIFAAKNNFDDSFILNTVGNITDSISSNVFTLKDTMLTTPPLSDGCMDGVMRKNILRICKQEKINLQEKSINENDLLAAEEIFFTNVVQGIRWVKSFSKKTYTNDFSKFLNSKLKSSVLQN
jgi:branched-chain amino acid aminotransferase